MSEQSQSASFVDALVRLRAVAASGNKIIPKCDFGTSERL